MSAINNRQDIFGEIHKRTILFDNEVKKEIQTGDFNMHYGDRYIPRRHKGETANWNTSTATHNSVNGVFDELLREALNASKGSTLNLQDPSVPRPFFTTCNSDWGNFLYHPQKWTVSNSSRYKDLDWMCKPRRKPLVDANSSHEFKGFSGTAVGTQIEWAWTGHIVSYCENSLLLWNPAEDVITKYDMENVVTIAYHPYNRALATSNHNKTRPSINVWTFERGAMHNCFNHCPRNHSMVTTLCWHRHGIHLLAGNANGVISTMDVYGSNKLFHETPANHSMIKDIKFSATGQYVASLDIVGKLCIWSYNSGYLVLHHEWSSGIPTNVAMDWHPWTDFDIVLLVQRGCVLLVLNILSKQTEAYSTGKAFRVDRPVIAFNKITAELVMGCQKNNQQRHRNMMVLGAIDNIVDEVQDVGNVDTAFMWSPNNEQLAFIGGNDIQIYNFFGTAVSSPSIRAPASNSANRVNEHKFSIFKQFDFIK